MAAAAVATPSNTNGGSNGTSAATTSAIDIPNGHHALQHSFVFWYMRRGKGANADQQQKKEDGDDTKEHSSASSPTAASAAVPNPYESSIKQIAEVNSVEQFWNIYDFLARPNDLPTTTDIHFFRSGVKPTWEDPQNAKGGKWLIRLKKGLASRYWEELVLALLGQQISTHIRSDEVNGVVISIRFSEDIISVWNKHAHDRDATEKIRDGIKKVLRLPTHVHMEYKPHQTSLADKSSFRNTTVWKGSGAGRGGGGAGGRGHHGSGGPRGSIGAAGDHLDDSSAPTRGRSGSFGEHVSLDEGGGPTPTNSRLANRRSNSWGEREPADRDGGGGAPTRGPSALSRANTSTGIGRGISGGGGPTEGGGSRATRPETERAWR